ncbi:Purkinje cell protein 2 homolog isoform X1 [Ambystoma mexicanum]|uniref:Purkinje cell protein 2 homolog isoform X1 n=1 Tax=Ambystoma mexicanum TaxID=8296 RepID=UPI0037E9AA65
MTTVEVKAKEERDDGSDSRSQSSAMEITPEQEGFFNLLSHVQGTRIDEQRCNIQIVHNKGDVCDMDEGSTGSPPPEMNMLMDMLAHSQSRRLDDQRAEFNYVPRCPNTDSNTANRSDNNGTANPKNRKLHELQGAKQGPLRVNRSLAALSEMVTRILNRSNKENLTQDLTTNQLGVCNHSWSTTYVC